MNIKTIYTEAPAGINATHIKFNLYYDLGGWQLSTYTPKPRGYYISVTPVTRETRNGITLETFQAFTGVYKCVKEVNRQSKKAESEALEEFESGSTCKELYNYIIKEALERADVNI